MLDYLGCTIRTNPYTTSTFYLLPLGRRLLLAREGQEVAGYPHLPIPSITGIHGYGNGNIPNRTFSDNHRENKSALFSVPIIPHRISLKYVLYFWLLRKDSNTVVVATEIVISSFGCSLRVTP